MVIQRKIAQHLLRLAREFPTVTIMGPRQSGKTTLSRAVFPTYDYVNLEEPDVRSLAKKDPRGFLQSHDAPMIIDEIQRVPELLSYIQGIVDRDGGNGRYILTGSHQPRLRAEVSQSLAGRTAILRLLPLSLSELKSAGITGSREDWIFRGFMPRIYQQGIEPRLLYGNYFETYIQRDVHQLINIKDHSSFEIFVRLLAGRVGQIVNLQGMAGEIGVSSVTLGNWLSILESSYVIFRLQPYYRNLGKRLTKSPKVYFTEVGLAAYLLGIQSADQVMQHPLFGGLFENMVVLEALKARYNAGEESNLYFYRDSRQLEVDLLLEKGLDLHTFEIKSSFTPSDEFTRGILAMKEMSNRIKSCSVVYSGELIKNYKGCRFVNFADFGDEEPFLG